MKCYSLKRKDIESHYKRMSSRYYLINDTMIQISGKYIASLLEELQPEIQVYTCNKATYVTDHTKIHQMALVALEKLCE